MSIEIWQFPKSATKEQLCAALKDFDFRRFNNVFNPGPAGTISMFWSDPDDYRSTSGVDASVLPLDRKTKRECNTRCDWVLRTRTSIWTTSFDKEMQNAVVRSVRQTCGGYFYNDHHGRNRYIPIAREPSTPASRGVYAVRARIEGELDALEHSLPKAENTSLQTPNGVITEANDMAGVLRVVAQFDPRRVLFNALVPFLVAAVEHYFRECFEILLKYSPDAQRRVEEQNRKITYPEAAAVSRGELTLERIASDWYSFQNLDSVQKAYKDVLQIDVWKVIRKRKKVREKLPLLGEALANLIQSRHGVVHHFAMNRQLDRNGFLDLLHLVRALIGFVSDEIERKLGIVLGLG